MIRINIADSFCGRQRFPTASVVDATSGAWMWRPASPCLFYCFFVFLLFLLERRGWRRTSFAPLHSSESIRGSQPGVWRFSFTTFTIRWYRKAYIRGCTVWRKARNINTNNWSVWMKYSTYTYSELIFPSIWGCYVCFRFFFFFFYEEKISSNVPSFKVRIISNLHWKTTHTVMIDMMESNNYWY